MNHVTVVLIPTEAVPSHESNDYVQTSSVTCYSHDTPRNKSTNNNGNRATTTTEPAARQLHCPPQQSSTTVDGIAAAIALRPQIKTIARELTGKDGRKVAKFERGGTGERIVPEDPLLKMAIAKQPNADGSGAGIIVSQG